MLAIIGQVLKFLSPLLIKAAFSLLDKWNESDAVKKSFYTAIENIHNSPNNPIRIEKLLNERRGLSNDA